jgi:hypothetical protein
MAFTYQLEHEDGTPADPPTYRGAVPNWNVGNAIPLGKNAPRRRRVPRRRGRPSWSFRTWANEPLATKRGGS